MAHIPLLFDKVPNHQGHYQMESLTRGFKFLGFRALGGLGFRVQGLRCPSNKGPSHGAGIHSGV